MFYNLHVKFCIKKEVLGTPKHLVVCAESNNIQWEHSVPHSAWIYGEITSDVMCLDEVLSILGLERPELIPEEYKTSFQSLGIEPINIPWHMCTPKSVFQKGINDVLAVSQKAVETLESCSYIETFMSSRKVLQKLTNALVDQNLLGKYIEETSSGHATTSALKSFIPDKNGKTTKITYTQARTSTGRLVVNSGPSILTLPSKYRDVISSKHTEGSVLQIDFVSLEPRVCRYISGKDAPTDLYNHISENILNNSRDRKLVKLAVLCALYGVSSKRLAGLLNSQTEARSIIRNVKKYFDVDQLERRLRGELISSGNLKNYYGRPLRIEDFDSHVLVSHYIQSTAVDVALTGFNKLLEKLESVGCKVDPLFIIHDALLLDVDRESLDILKDVIKNPVSLPMGEFPVSLEIISQKRDI